MLYWWLHSFRRAVRNAWYRLDKEAFVVAGLVLVVVGGLIFAMQAVFAERDASRERLRAYNEENLACLARNIYFEARGEPLAGQYAVAEVTMNRKASGLYPDTVCEVVHQKNWDPLRGRYVGAFSWTELDGLPAPTGAEWEQARQVAEAVYYSRYAPALHGALYYHATYIRPPWARQKTLVSRIGRHVFYR